MPVATPLKIVVVPHTHWDREWYQPFELFRMRLVRLIDRLLELFATDPAYTHFMLDGQAIVLEDYLAIEPEREEALRALITSGKVAVGPWYVLPDEFLVSGEALVRNLQLGLATARRFGRSMELGYLPDSFGHVAQMPQIFRGFGFDAGCLWRGVAADVPGLEWQWAALDGSTIYVQWLSGGYGNFANLPADEAAADARLAEEVARLGAHARSPVRLLMNGSDHLLPQTFLPRFLAGWRNRHANWEIVQGSLAEAIAAARAGAGPLETVTGELRSPALSHLLPGVLSSRSYLHIANVRAQTLLERWVEPFAALAMLAGRAYPGALVRHAWKTLLQNHPHDSICGCSVDAVHRQMLTRYEQVMELGAALARESFAQLQGEDADDPELSRQAGIQLYNPHPFAQRAPVEVDLVLDTPAGEVPAIALYDADGRAVPYELRALEWAVRPINRSPLYPLNVSAAHVRLAVVADLPPLGHVGLRLAREAGAGVQGAPVAGHAIENEDFRVEAAMGGVRIHDKRLGETIVHHFEDRADRGDEYNHCPVDGETALDSRAWAWERATVTTGPETARLVLVGEWPLPRGLAADRHGRADEVLVPVRLEVALHRGVRRVECAFSIDNQAHDHRLRAAFRLPGAIAETHADTAFGWVTRPAGVPAAVGEEAPVGTHPLLGQVHVECPGGRVGLAAMGLHEHEADGETLYLTLLRCVGWLSRDDLSTRVGDAGPMLPAPGAQCPGPITFRYAWLSADAAEPAGTLARRGDAFVVPATGFPTAETPALAPRSFLACDQPAWQLSALKRAENGDSLVVRVFNGTGEPATGTLAPGFPVRRAWRARLDETPLEATELTATLGPFEIATFLLEP